MNGSPSSNASDAALILSVWQAQYGGAEAQARASGLPQALRSADETLQRQARIVEAFWTVRRGDPPPTFANDLAHEQAQCLAAGDLQFAAIAQIAVAQWHGRNQDYPNAAEAALAALALCKQQQPVPSFDLAMMLNGVGVYQSHLTQWPDALDHLYQGIQCLNDLSDPGLGSALHSNLGTIFFSTGNFEDALKQFEHAWKITLLSDNVRQGRNIALNLAHTLCRLRRWEEALTWTQPLLAPPIDPGLLGAYALAFAARAAAGLGRAEQALAWARQANEMAETHGNPDETAAASLALGHALLADGQYALALQTFERTRERLGTAGEVVYQMEAEEGRAQAARALSDDATAVQALESAMALRERIGSLATRTQVAAARIRGRLDELKEERNRARTAQAEAEAALAALRAAQSALLQAQQRAMASQLMASLAHQFNTPLGNCITANSSQHDGLQALDTQAQFGTIRRTELRLQLEHGLENAELIGSNLARLSRLVERFKLFGTHRFVTHERLPDLIEEVARQASSRAKRPLSDCVVLDVSDLDLACDRDALQGLLAELLDNALRAQRPLDPPVRLRAHLDDEAVQLEVQDWGPGMSSEQLAQALDPFKSPASQSGPMGLGLGWAIVNHLARQIAATDLTLSSEPGAGTWVRLRIPIRPQ